MADIATKMREWAKFGYGHEASQDMVKAAAEIERLREALEEITKVERYYGYEAEEMLDIARAALGGENG
jgi:hypothetical protein